VTETTTPAHHEGADVELPAERALDQRLLKNVLMAGAALFFIFIIAVSLQ
jgi:hypothetical protein